MYCTDSATGETQFAFSAPAIARKVILECFIDGEHRRVPMLRRAREWVAFMHLPAGWFFYRFEVDGKPRWDRSAGKLRTEDGRLCSFGMIQRGANPIKAN